MQLDNIHSSSSSSSRGASPLVSPPNELAAATHVAPPRISVGEVVESPFAVVEESSDPFADCSGGEVQTQQAAGGGGADEVCEVEELLLEVGKKIGRKETELRPYIDKVVKENWLETYDALQNLDDDEWRDLGLPKRLGMMLREAIARRTDGTASTNAVQDVPNASLPVPVPALVTCSSTPAIPSVMTPTETEEQCKSLTDFHFDDTADEVVASFLSPKIVQDATEVVVLTAAERRKEVENFIIEVGEDLGRTSDDMADVIDKIVNVNWIDSLDRLCDLTEESWQKLQLPIYFVETARQKLNLLPGGAHQYRGSKTSDSTAVARQVTSEIVITDGMSAQETKGPIWDGGVQNGPQGIEQHSTGQHNSEESISLSEWEKQIAVVTGTAQVKVLFSKLGAEFGRADADMLALADKVIQKFNIETVAELSLISPTAYAELGVPLRLQTTLRTLVQNHAQVQMYGKQQPARDSSVVRPPPIKYYSYPECPLPNKEIPIEDFLERVGRNIGKDEVHMVPYVTRIVQDHWYDSVAALRKLTDSEWKELQLPRRLLDEIRISLSDPEALDLSTVFNNPPDPAYFVCDVDLAVRRIEKEIPVNILRDTVRSLVKLMETILSRPHDRMKRRIRKANPNFHKRAGKYPSTILLLQSVGYQDVGDYWILSVAYATRLTEAHEALTKLAMSEYKKGRR